MKYLKYISIVLFSGFRKIFGLFWFWLVFPFRGYARNVVYNYKLQNNLWLKRLYERPIEKTFDGWVISAYHNTNGGYIKYRKVNKLQYLLMYWLVWGWVDDDTTYDTISKGYLEEVVVGEHFHPITHTFFIEHLTKVIDKLNSAVYGNTFDIGDARADNAQFDIIASGLWLGRNCAYNFKYDQYETIDESDVFYFELFGKKFGWGKDGILNGKQTYTLLFFND